MEKNFFKECREASGMRQAEVAAVLGVDRSAVAKWETGKALPKTGHVMKLAQLYGTSMEKLLGAGGEAV